MHYLSSVYFVNQPPNDGLQICPKYVEVDWRSNLRVNSAPSWFLLHRYIEMQRQQHIKLIQQSSILNRNVTCIFQALWCYTLFIYLSTLVRVFFHPMFLIGWYLIHIAWRIATCWPKWECLALQLTLDTSLRCHAAQWIVPALSMFTEQRSVSTIREPDNWHAVNILSSCIRS